jgi:hypothetical protein
MYYRNDPNYPKNLPKIVQQSQVTKKLELVQTDEPAAKKHKLNLDMPSYKFDDVNHATAAHLFHHLSKRFDAKIEEILKQNKQTVGYIDE